ncbi:MAG: glycosyltransferase [Pyrinomonadaceae bacterium]
MRDSLEKPTRHILTVLLEDYFHVGAFNSIIQKGQWYRFETRFEQNTVKALELLDRFDIKATFFVLGWIADQNPELVKEIARRGHEIANRGYYHRSIRQMTPEEFREDLRRSRAALEKASETRVHGYRAAQRLNYHVDQWALDVLAEEGYAYDSSLMPTARSVRDEPRLRFAHKHQCGENEMWEFPYSTYRLGGSLIPISGGNYFRQLPHTLVKRAVRDWDRRYDAPFVMYFHVWELDPEQPRISAASPVTRIRHYRKLDKMRWVLEDYLSTYQFVGAADYLGLTSEPRPVLELEAGHDEPVAIDLPAQVATPAARLTQTVLEPISIVIPCYNEELILPYLANTLRSVEEKLSKQYDLRFIFVDDCSSDNTWNSLQENFGGHANCTLLRHPQNWGVAAGIMTGLRHAETDIVCSIDCDCTYDPHELTEMIPLLTEGVDLVTASPYHPLGGVRNVPEWRLALSKASSFLYRQVLRQKLYTYTSCFRVYRRDAVNRMALRETGFLGVAEMLGRLDLSGHRVVEYPATLEVRLFGWSKMKILRTVAGHLKLLTRLLALRLSGAKSKSTPTIHSDPALESGSSPITIVTPK